MTDDIWGAISSGNASRLSILLAANAQLANCSTGRGMTPLILATQTDNQEIVECLISYGADPNAATNISSPVSGRLDRCVTPIMFARSVEVIDILVKSGGSINVMDANGRSAFFRIAGSFDVKLIDKIIECGAIISNKELKRLFDGASSELESRKGYSGDCNRERMDMLATFLHWYSKFTGEKRGP